MSEKNFDRTSNTRALLEQVQNHELFTDELRNDEKVFMALRKDALDFYYKGSLLFSYGNDGFSSHVKFCIIPEGTKKYVLEKDLQSVRIYDDFKSSYKKIKDNAAKYAGVEAAGISALHSHGYRSGNSHILLDTEIALYGDEKNDRIDFLLYDQVSKKLTFVEAKHYSNKELWSQEGTKPKVVDQIMRYKDTLEKKNIQVLEEYQEYVRVLNDAFNMNIEVPEMVADGVLLCVFGYDSDQKARIERLLKKDKSLDGIPAYFIGDPKEMKPENILNNGHR